MSGNGSRWRSRKSLRAGGVLPKFKAVLTVIGYKVQIASQLSKIGGSGKSTLPSLFQSSSPLMPSLAVK